MKIISKYKDYYDYLSGIYGIDEKKVLDRTQFKSYIIPEDFDLIVCNIPFKRVSRKFYDEEIKNKRFYYWRSYAKFETIYIGEDYVWLKNKDENHRVVKKCPIIMIYSKTEYFYPPLKPLGFDKVMRPEDIYKLLDEFISYKEPELKNLPEDMSRFESKGFDKKISFRNIK